LLAKHKQDLSTSECTLFIKTLFVASRAATTYSVCYLGKSFSEGAVEFDVYNPIHGEILKET